MFEGDDSNSKSPEKIRFFYVFATTGLVLSPFRLILCMSSLKPMYRHFPSTPGPPKPHQPEIASTSQVPILPIFQYLPTCPKKYVQICPYMANTRDHCICATLPILKGHMYDTANFKKVICTTLPIKKSYMYDTAN